MRSAIAPEIRAGVMMANVIWNSMKIAPGMVSARWTGPAPTFAPARRPIQLMGLAANVRR